jgi:hypothetical protein
MENYTNSEMTDMILCYGVALRAQALYREKFRARYFAFANISGCCLNGTFRPRSVDKGQERTPRMSDFEPQILETGRKLEQGLHPYHVQRVQALQPNDCIRRQEFCDWVIQMCIDQPDFLRIILLTEFLIRDDAASFERVRDNLHRRTQACRY